MSKKSRLIISQVVMLIALISYAINRTVIQFPDAIVRIIGIIVLINIPIMVYLYMIVIREQKEQKNER